MYKTMKIYYNKVDGTVLWNVAYNYHIEPNLDNDYATVKELNQYEKSAVGLIVLRDGKLAQDFAESVGVRVNLTTLSQLPAGEEWKSLEFSYPDPNNSAATITPVVPLSVQVEQLKAETASMNLSIIDIWETLLV